MRLLALLLTLTACTAAELRLPLTAGHTLCSYAPIELLADGWIRAAVAPELIEANANGASYGLCVSDETGQTRANNDVYCREQSNGRPYLVVDAEPDQPAASLTNVRVEPAPEAATPTTGAARLRFDLSGADPSRLALTVNVNGTPLPRWQTPFARPGANQVVLPGLPPDEALTVEVSLWKWGQATFSAQAAGRSSQKRGQATFSPVATPAGRKSSLTPFSVPGYASVHPVTGNVLEEVGPGRYAGEAAGEYRQRNPVWSADGVRLAAARGETVAVQLVGIEPDAVAQVALPPLPASAVQTFALWYVQDPAPVAEVAVPSRKPRPDGNWQDLAGRRYWPLLVEITVPKDTPAGVHHTTWRLGEQFHVSLNSYGRVHDQFGIRDGSSDEALRVENEYHRLAHAHRLCWAPLTYNQAGGLDWGAGPALSGPNDAPACDFTDFDRRFGPLLDGSAFAGLPRSGVPLDHLYLPFCENWPSPIAAYRFQPSTREYPAIMVEHALQAPAVEEALDAAWQARYVAVAEAFARHLAERGWSQTQFQCYFNDKYDFRDPKQGGRGTSWWLLDEPMHRDDWLALRFLAGLFKDGWRKAGSPANVVVRADISRPQWQRDWLDGRVDVEVLGGAFYDYRERTLGWLRQERATGWTYGTANRVGESNENAVGWCLQAYLAGVDGVVPWNSIGGDGHFERAEPTALLYPGKRFGINGSLASLRLKALRAGEQEVERLRLLAAARGWDREQVAAAVAGVLELKGQARSRGGEDAGWVSFAGLRPEDTERLRETVAAELGDAAP
ncbi:MAG: hypothetical protein HYU66_05800 [Armatimonadetes bacterium]|nr:hypothetical protein [Armatimonadota bacterium]